MVRTILAASVLAVALADECVCQPGTPTQDQIFSMNLGSLIFAAAAKEARAAFQAADECQQGLWREAFILSAAWEGNHEALGRFARASAAEETYFVVPTTCALDECLDHRVDWAKNALLDTMLLMEFAGLAESRGWGAGTFEGLLAEEVLGNVAEILVDESCNDRQWIYCPTSYNPIAPWHTDANNMTLLPQFVWVDMPKDFWLVVRRYNCSLDSKPAPALGDFLRTTRSSLRAEASDPSCRLTRGLVTAAFGNEAAEAADALVEAQVRAAAPGVLAAFKRAAPPTATFAGLREMFRYASDSAFRAGAGELFDALVGGAAGAVV